mmetsp:Transcript_37982/g.59244  ORF Transcript_37982/g.59244 Transcript_37982/m.59244 type:complete len:530 (+) Transcript_37982:72-1661(+)
MVIIGLGGSGLIWKLLSLRSKLLWFPFAGPRGHWLAMSPKRPPNMHTRLAWITHWAKQFSEKDGQTPVSFRIMGRLFVLVPSLADIKELLKARPDPLTRTKGFYVATQGTHHPGLFNANGTEWKRQRRIYAPAFNAKNVEGMLNTIEAKANALTSALHKQQVVAVREWFQYFTTDVICEVAFGLRFNCLDSSGEDEASVRSREIVKNVTELFEDVKLRVESPLAMLSLSLPIWIQNLFSVNRKRNQLMGQLNQYMSDVASERLRLLKKNPSDAKSDLLDQAILSALKDPEPVQEYKLVEMLASNIFTFFVAGSETTASTLSYLFYYLAHHPQWQDAARQQARQLLVKADQAAPSVKDYEQVDVVKACVMETMRLNAVVPFLGSEVSREGFSFKGMQMPKGTIMLALARQANTDPSKLEDPMSWRPERWLEGTDPASMKLDLNASERIGIMPDLAFGYGPRVCPGKRLAELELVLVTAKLLHEFNSIEPLHSQTAMRMDEGHTIGAWPIMRFGESKNDYQELMIAFKREH